MAADFDFYINANDECRFDSITPSNLVFACCYQNQQDAMYVVTMATTILKILWIMPIMTVITKTRLTAFSDKHSLIKLVMCVFYYN